MSCEELDRLRLLRGTPASSWPPEAIAHLKTCARCSQLQAILDEPAEPAVPAELQSRIEAAILPALSPVTPLPGPLRVAIGLILAGATVAVLANWRLGTAGWHARSALQLYTTFALLSISWIALAKTLAVRMMPGSRDTSPLQIYIVAPLLAILAADTFLFGYKWNPNFVPVALWCWLVGTTCAAISAPLFWMILRRGYWLNPVAQGAAAGLLAGLVGVAVLELYCPYLDRLHIATGHVGAAAAASLLGAAIGAASRGVLSRR